MPVVKHIVTWRLQNTPMRVHQCWKIKEMLEGLRAVIPAIHRLEVGINLIPGPDAGDVVLYSEFLTWEDLAAYQKHPEHVKAAEYVNSVRDTKIVVDYEGEDH